MSTPAAFDIVIIGAGPAGQKAAIQGAKAGKRVALLERERGIGGSCVYRGTIPSKTLRESALHLDRLRRASAAFEFSLKPDAEISTLLSRLEEVVQTHDTYMSKQLRRNGISAALTRLRRRTVTRSRPSRSAIASTIRSRTSILPCCRCRAMPATSQFLCLQKPLHVLRTSPKKQLRKLPAPSTTTSPWCPANG